MAIQNLRVPVADYQQEIFCLRGVKIWNKMEKSLIKGRRRAWLIRKRCRPYGIRADRSG